MNGGAGLIALVVIAALCWPSAEEAVEQEMGGGGSSTSQTLDP